MLNLRCLAFFPLAAGLTFLGCHAQTPVTPQAAAAAPAGKPVSADEARRIEVLLRRKATGMPPEAKITVGPRVPSELPGWDTVTVSVSAEGATSKPITFLLSADGKSLAQWTKFDISADPKTVVSDSGRPARGGPENAPVVIVGFDDLECPYCSRMHAALFPALTQRYGKQVRIVYKDFPLPAEMHPWAMHASVDVNCLLPESPDGYWNLVDYIHAHYSEIGVSTNGDNKQRDEKAAEAQLDQLTLDQAKFQKLDQAKVAACVAKQDQTAVKASMKIGDSLNVDATPSLFINGAKVDGAVSLEYVYGMIDSALRAEGVTPPPPYVAPAPVAPPSPLIQNVPPAAAPKAPGQ